MKNFLGYFGATLIIAGTFTPMFRVIIVNWNFYDAEIIMAIATLVCGVVGLAASLMQKPALQRWSAIFCLFILALTALGALMKIHNSFSFISFKKLNNIAEGMVKFKYGWYILIGGCLSLLLNSFINKVKKDFKN